MTVPCRKSISIFLIDPLKWYNRRTTDKTLFWNRSRIDRIPVPHENVSQLTPEVVSCPKKIPARTSLIHDDSDSASVDEIVGGPIWSPDVSAIIRHLTDDKESK